MTVTTTSQQQQQIDLGDLFTPILAPLNNPVFIGYFGLLVLLFMLSAFTGGSKPKVYDGRFANKQEIQAARKEGLKQIALQVPKEPALELDDLVLPSLAPAVAIIGGSGSGKTRTYFNPALKSGIDQGWTHLVFDVKGNLMKKHAAYAHAMGYDVYVYAPGFPYSDGLNFLDFMENEADAKAAYQLAEILQANFKDPESGKSDEFFGSQGIALLKTVFMLAKSSPFPDLFTAWKFLSLDNLAERLQAAYEYGLFDGTSKDFGVANINTWIGEAALPLRSVSPADETSVGIVGTATTHLQKLVDRSIMPCLLKSTIPLDLPGKQIVFFQMDEKAKAVTAPLVAAAMNMLIYRNLNGTVERTNTFGVWLDELVSFKFPDLEDLINRSREYGGLFSLGYQSNPQMKLKYNPEYLNSVLASCSTQFVFRTGDPNTAEKFSSKYGDSQEIFTTESRTYGKNSQRTVTQHLQKVRLVPANKIENFRRGEAMITNPGFKGYPYKKKLRILWRNDWLWFKCGRIWKKEIKPILIEQAQQRFKGTSLEAEKVNREVIADAILPSSQKLKAFKNVQELRARTADVT